MVKPKLGHIEEVELRAIWPNEESDFTPWLAITENIKRLSKVLDMELEVTEREKSVGPFSADLYCKDINTEELVLIENQLNCTDHNHLGQIITYAAGLDAVKIIWIAKSFTDEHRAALDWLNRISPANISFFGIQIEVWKIGESDAAPNFKIVSQPSDWPPSTGITQFKKMQLEFWNQFQEYLESTKSVIKPTKPKPHYFMKHNVFNRNDFLLYSVFTMWDSITNLKTTGELQVVLEISSKEANNDYNKLDSQKEEIEKESNLNLIWDKRGFGDPDSKVKNIYIRKQIDMYDTSKWDEYFAWLKENLEKFKQIFTPRIAKL